MCGESRMHGVDRGKRRRLYQTLTYRYSFFTDPTISTLTSGTPSQNVDLAGMSFPRRLGVRFNPDFITQYHLTGLQAKWQAYADKDFKESLGKEFYHEDLITREGWAKYYFKGIFPKDIAYIQLQIINPQSGMLVKVFYFKFQKAYQTSLDGRYYVSDPILDEKIVKNGILTELKKKRVKDKDGNEKIIYKSGKSTFKQKKIKDILNGEHVKEDVKINAIMRMMVRYSERPKMVFLVTPPHLMKYAKLILILVKQLVDLNFDQSYMTKSNQKPLYKTRFMLDELGNLQSEGHGIDGFATMLSIGLGQEQQFTLILQTLQQLRDVYGDSVDKIVQGNTSNIVFLKSTDDSMLDTLQKMSGTTHKAFTDSKTITRDMERLFMKNEGKASYTMTTREVPVISYNDMAFITDRNSIVFRAGDSPIWNRNETILPMSWRLFSNTITQPGKDYSLQTIPSLSTAVDFDVRRNQPDFRKMLDKRMEQAIEAQSARELYADAYDYTEYDIEKQDPDVYSDEVMDLVNRTIRARSADIEEEDYDMYEDYEYENENFTADAEDNTEQMKANNKYQAEYEQRTRKIFARGTISPDDLVSMTGLVNHVYDKDIIASYLEVKGYMWQDTGYFVNRNGSLYGVNGELYIKLQDNSEALATLNDAMKDEDSNVFGEEEIDKNDVANLGSYEVTDAFIRFLADQPSWSFANNEFEKEMGRRLMDD